MKTLFAVLKKIILSLLVLIILLLITALFVDGNYAVKKEITINQSNQVVFTYISHLKNQANYGVWNKIDPKMKKTYTGIDSTVGFTYAWQSNNENVGVGLQRITKIIPNKRIELDLEFKVPFEAKNKTFMTCQPINAQQTKVEWGFSGKYNYPMNILNLFMDMDKMVGKDFDQGLKNLKEILEKQ